MKDASDVRTMLVDSATRLFADHVDSKMLDAAKRDGWSPALWQIVEDAQLALVSVPEEAGGAGGTLSDLAAVLRIAGERRKVPITIRADGRATHQSVVTAMDVAGRLGFVHLSIATINTQEKP